MILCRSRSAGCLSISDSRTPVAAPIDLMMTTSVNNITCSCLELHRRRTSCDAHLLVQPWAASKNWAQYSGPCRDWILCSHSKDTCVIEPPILVFMPLGCWITWIIMVKCSYTEYIKRVKMSKMLVSSTSSTFADKTSLIDLHLAIRKGFSASPIHWSPSLENRLRASRVHFSKFPTHRKPVTRRSMHTTLSSLHAYNGIGPPSRSRIQSCSQSVMFLRQGFASWRLIPTLLRKFGT